MKEKGDQEKMSDAWWDYEYDKAYDLKQEIKRVCKEKSIECPVFKQYIRSWELEPILKEIKNTQ